MRSALGAIALGALAKKPELLTGSVIRNLERLARNALRFAKESDQEASILNHLEFQDAIVKASNLEKTARYFEELTAEVVRFNNLLKMSYTDREKDAEERVDALAQALKENDFAAAESIWRQSFTLAAERFIERVVTVMTEPLSGKVVQTNASACGLITEQSPCCLTLCHYVLQSWRQ